MRHIYAIGLLVALTGLVGCAASKERPPPPDAIQMTSNSFDPATRRIEQGSTLTFHNPGSGRGALHILVSGDQGAARREQGAASFGGAAGHRSERGEVWTTPVWSTPGTFHITCTIHPEMNLTVTVTPA